MLSISNTARIVRLRNKSSLSYRTGILNFSPLRAIMIKWTLQRIHPPGTKIPVISRQKQGLCAPVPVPHLFKMVSNTNLRLSPAKGPRSLVLAPKYQSLPLIPQIPRVGGCGALLVHKWPRKTLSRIDVKIALLLLRNHDSSTPRVQCTYFEILKSFVHQFGTLAIKWVGHNSARKASTTKLKYVSF